MNVKNILVANILNIFALILIVVMYFLFPKPIAIVLGVAWFVYVIYSNYKLILSPEDDSSSMLEKLNSKKHGKISEVVKMVNIQNKKLSSYSDFFENLQDDNKLKETYYAVIKQVEINIGYIEKYLSSVDYSMDSDLKKLGSNYYPIKVLNLLEENSNLIEKVGDIVESSIDIDKSVQDVDLSMLDDIINSLRSMSNE